MKPEELDDLTERYVMNALLPGERSLFESQLKDHPEWEERIKLHQLLKSSLNPARISFRQKLKDINTDSKKKADHSRIIPWIIRIAAGLLIIVSAGYYLFINYSKKSPERLYTLYMTAPSALSPELIPLRGLSEPGKLSTKDSILHLADTKYIEGSIAEAITTLKSYPNIPNDDKVLFQLGLLYLIQGDANEAIVYFQKASRYDQNEINWYSAMAYLKLNQTNQCKIALNKINTDSRWSVKSKECLMMMK